MVALYDNGISTESVYRFAALHGLRITLHDLLVRTDRDQLCARADVDCEAWFGWDPIYPGQPLALESGACLSVVIQRYNVPPIDPHTWDDFEAADADYVNLLQRDSRLLPGHATADTNANQHSPGPGQDDAFTINLRPVIVAFEQIDNHFFLPQYVSDPTFPWHPASIPWLDLPLWAPGDPCNELAIYYDGSCLSDGAGGLAAAAFIRIGSQWYFAGFLSGHLDTTTAYQAEQLAALTATKFAHDLLKLIFEVQPWMPTMWFGYDSLTVGSQASGLWATKRSRLIGKSIRTLHRLLQLHFGVQCEDYHIRGHHGEAGNEFVDVLAQAAAQGKSSSNIRPFLDYFQAHAFVSAFEWSWILFDKEFAQFWDDFDLKLPRRPTTVPTAEILPIPTSATTSDEPNGALTLTLCTYNVLTLRSDNMRVNEMGVSGPSRQESVLRQFHEAGVVIFGLQETRLKGCRQQFHDNYLLVKGSATTQGHGGTLLGFSKTLPHGTLNTTRGPRNVYFSEDHISITATSDRFIVARVVTPILRAIFIVGHAPHTGTSEADIEAWWLQLYQLIPNKYADWDRILVCDSNARVGSRPTEAIGEHQAEKHNGKSQYFCDFVHASGLFLSGTFATWHIGDGGTWMHHTQKWIRNDYIGLPARWTYSAGVSQVLNDVDASLLRDDHRAVAVTFQAPALCKRPVVLTKMPKYTDDQFQHVDWNHFCENTCLPWTMDVHTHAAELQKSLVNLAAKGHRPRRRPFKSTMSEDTTWQLVCEKKECRLALHQQNRQQRLLLLQVGFSAFLAHRYHRCARLLGEQADANLISLDSTIAQTYHQFREVCKAVTLSMRTDDGTFFTRLATRASDFLHPNSVRQFWKEIRRSIPRFRNRTLQPHPQQFEALEDQWHPHFEDLEVGTPVRPHNWSLTVTSTS